MSNKKDLTKSYGVVKKPSAFAKLADSSANMEGTKKPSEKTNEAKGKDQTVKKDKPTTEPSKTNVKEDKGLKEKSKYFDHILENVDKDTLKDPSYNTANIYGDDRDFLKFVAQNAKVSITDIIHCLVKDFQFKNEKEIKKMISDYQKQFKF